MNLLQLLPAEGYKHVAGTSGGEWHGPCPWCGGRDRFSVWPEHTSGATGGRYSCRQCGKSGDAIQFLRDRDGLSYPDACRALQVEPRPLTGSGMQQKATSWEPRHRDMPSVLWQERAGRFVAECAARMLPDSEGMSYAASRGLTPETVARLRIGWNDRDRYDDRGAWGLPQELKDNGKPRRMWLPAGLVIPTRRKAGLASLKVRRSAWTTEDEFPKYVAVAGSVPGLALGGGNGKPVVIVESELDAVLVHQEAGGLVGALALGTASGKPDADATAYLRAAPRLLVALDFDEAGFKAFPWWRQHFAQAKPWPTPEGKDVGDLASVPGYIRAWVEAAFLEEPKAVAWPRPEPGPLDTTMPRGRYACLEALAAYFGAGLVREAGGGLTLAFPSSVPPEPAQAIRDGFAELQGYIQERAA